MTIKRSEYRAHHTQLLATNDFRPSGRACPNLTPSTTALAKIFFSAKRDTPRKRLLLPVIGFSRIPAFGNSANMSQEQT